MKNTTPKLATLKRYTNQRKLELALDPTTSPKVLYDLYHLIENYEDSDIKKAIRCNPNITKEMYVTFVTEMYAKPFNNPSLDLFMMEDGFIQDIIKCDTSNLYINNSLDRRLMRLVLDRQVNECINTGELPKGLYFGCTCFSLVKEFPDIMDRLLKHVGFDGSKVETPGSIGRNFAAELLKARLATAAPEVYMQLVSKEIVTWRFLLRNLYYIPKAQHMQFITHLLFHADMDKVWKAYIHNTVMLAYDCSTEIHEVMYSLTDPLSKFIRN